MLPTIATSGPSAPLTESLASCAPVAVVVAMAAPWLINEMAARITTAMTVKNTPAVVAAEAGPRRQPRRTSALTNGRKVAASTTPSTIDTATVGMSVTIRIATPTTRISARSRTLHWASRSSQPGTRSGVSYSGPGSRIVSTAPQTANTMATNGIATKSPMMPAIAAPAGSDTSTSAGCMLTVLP